MSDDDDGGIVWERVWTALKDDEGIHLGRAFTAARHEIGLDDAALFGVVATLFGYAYFVEGTYDVTDGLLMLAILVGLAGITVARAISDYYEHDEELAIKELRKRYAADEISFAAFQRQVDRVIAGEDVDVFDTGDEDEDPGATDPDADPIEVLRTRYARGEIDDREFDRRLERLEATGRDSADRSDEDAPGGRDREFEFET